MHTKEKEKKPPQASPAPITMELVRAMIRDIEADPDKVAHMGSRQWKEQYQANIDRIMDKLNRANASLSHLLTNVRGFRQYFDEQVSLHREYFGDKPAEAILGEKGNVFSLETFGYANHEGTLCLVIRDGSIILTEYRVSHDLEIWYQRRVDRQSFSFIDSQFILTELDRYARPELLLKKLLLRFITLDHARHKGRL